MNSSSNSNQLLTEKRIFDDLKQGENTILSRIQIVISIAISLIMVSIVHLVVPKLTLDSPLFPDEGDHILYISMAEGNLAPIPFGSRVLVPLIARCLSAVIGLELGFYIISILSIFSTAIVIFLFLHEMGIGFELALAGEMTFLSLGYTTKMFLFNFWLVDPLLIFFVMLSLYALARNDDRLFLLSIILGVLTKETMLLLIPVYLIFNWRGSGSNRKHVMNTTIFGFISFGLFFSLRFMTPNTENYDFFSEVILRTSVHLQTFLADPLNKIISLYAGIWGLYILSLIVIAIVAKPHTFLIIIPLIILFYMQLLITGNGASNVTRVLLVAVGPIILLQLVGAERISKFGIPKTTFLFVGFSFFLLNTFNDLVDDTAAWIPGHFYSMYAAEIKYQLVLLLFWVCIFVIYISIMQKKLVSSDDAQVPS